MHCLPRLSSENHHRQRVTPCQIFLQFPSFFNFLPMKPFFQTIYCFQQPLLKDVCCYFLYPLLYFECRDMFDSSQGKKTFLRGRNNLSGQGLVSAEAAQSNLHALISCCSTPFTDLLKLKLLFHSYHNFLWLQQSTAFIKENIVEWNSCWYVIDNLLSTVTKVSCLELESICLRSQKKRSAVLGQTPFSRTFIVEWNSFMRARREWTVFFFQFPIQCFQKKLTWFSSTIQFYKKQPSHFPSFSKQAF